MKNSSALHRRLLPYLIITLASLFYAYDYFLQVAPSVMTHQLMAEFAIGAGRLSLMSAFFYYSYVGMQIPAGMLLDRFGARRLLTFAVMFSGVGVLLFGMSTHYLIAGFARFIMGVAFSFSFVSSLFLAARWFAHKYFGLLIGVVEFTGSIGSVFGMGPLAVVINHFGWRHAMVMAGWITIVCAAVYWFVIRDRKHITAQRRKKHGITGFRALIQIPQLRWVVLCALFTWAPSTVIGALWGVPYLMKAYGWTNAYAGKVCSLFWLALAISAPLIGWWSDRVRSRRQPLYVCFISGVAAALVFVMPEDFPRWMVVAALPILGFAASSQALTFGILKDILPPKIFGTATGINNMSVIAGGAIAQQIAGFLLSLRWRGGMIHGVPVYGVSDFRVALWVVPIMLFIGLLLLTFKVRETHCKPQF